MATAKSWIKAARPRTLPLALSGIIMGCGLAWYYGKTDPLVSLLAILTATLIQVFSNFANDYGDSQKGTDNENRLGPTRTIQGGEISPGEMKKGMVLVGIASLISGVLLVYFGTWENSRMAFFSFIALGILSLIAAYFYTAGKKSYGYVGLGDLAVFIFFGLLPVLGAFYLNTREIVPEIMLPALSIGLFSTGVLNLNNMRDVENDKNSGKITVAVLLGKKNSRRYHYALIAMGMAAAIVFIALAPTSIMKWLGILSVPLFIRDLVQIGQIKGAQQLDPFLKKLALSTLAFTLLFCAGLIVSTL